MPPVLLLFADEVSDIDHELDTDPLRGNAAAAAASDITPFLVIDPVTDTVSQSQLVCPFCCGNSFDDN